MIAVLPRTSDADLVAAYRAGDRHAFDAIHARYHVRLERFARRMLSSNPSVAEDVVQEAMLRASRALLRDDRRIELKPWLFRLVRNCALDEISRVRTDSVALDDDERHVEPAAPFTQEPEAVAERRLGVREVLEDLAALPEAQRHALVRREVDGLSHEQVARELGLTEQATKSLVFRARRNLVREREARTAECADVRRALIEAADAHRRAPAWTLRHIAHCSACRAFRRDLQTQRRVVALLTPGPLLLLGVGGLKLGGGLVAGKKAAVAATATVATVGAVGLGTQVFGPGDPSPLPVQSKAVPEGRLASGAPLPAGTAIVRTALELRAGALRRREVTITCPPGTRVADLLQPSGAPLAVGYAPGTIVGHSRRATVRFEPATLPRPARVTVSVLCKRPAASGTILAPDARGAAAPTHRVVVDDALLLVRPDGRARGSVRRGQPIAVTGASGAWRRVVTDDGARGWLRAAALERIR